MVGFLAPHIWCQDATSLQILGFMPLRKEATEILIKSIQ